MNRFFFLVTALIILGQVNPLFAQTYVWEQGFGGNNDDEGMGIATDHAGYVYITGKFQSPSINFGSIVLNNVGGVDAFVAKFTATGNPIWALDIGGTGDDIGRGIAVDQHGNVNVIGSYTSPSMTVGATILTNNGTTDMFMVRLDSAGNILWAKTAGGSGQDNGYCVAADSAGYIYFGGYYSSGSITFGTFVLAGGGQSNIAVAKYDTLGNCIWAKHPVGTGFLYGIATDKFGHVFLGGTIKNTVNFGNGVTLTSGGLEDAFIARYDTSGTAQWARKCSGTGSDWGEAVATDPVGNSYLTGSYSSTALTIGSTVLSNAGSYDYFIAKWDSSGNSLWAKGGGGTMPDGSFGLCTDNCWNVYVVGTFTSPSITIGNTTLINPGVGTNQMFISKYDSSGLLEWAIDNGGSNEDFCYSITSDLNNNIYMTGSYASDSVVFGNDTLYNHGNYDVCIGKLGVLIKSAFTTSDTIACLPASVAFINNSIDGNTFLWNFGDGSTSNAVNPVHTYSDTGTFTVTLIAINISPCGIIKDTLTLVNYIKIVPSATTAFVADTTTGCTPLTVNFINSSSNASSYLWNFGDGNTSTAASPSHTYTTAGSFTVTLIGYTPNGCNDTTTINNYILTNTITVSSSFTADTLSGCIPVTVSFTNTSANGTSYLWSFGDGNSSPAFNPTHIYDTSGSFIVTLIAYNTSTCGVESDTFKMSDSIVVSSPIPIKSQFTTDSIIGCIPFAVKFINQSINATDFYWNFGDRNTDSLTDSPTHLFNDSGTYHIVLVASNPNNVCRLTPDTTSLDITGIPCEQLFIPNSFTPNNDGYNDYFNIVAEGFTEYHLVIFDRWGVKVFESTQSNFLWDGYNQAGIQVPTETYYYVFSAKDFTNQLLSFKGFINLVR